jgi:murein L,D-transpeptidase YcbB/YkuD
MFMERSKSSCLTLFLIAALTLLTGMSAPSLARAELTALKQAIAEAAARDDDIARYYRGNGYSTIWTGGSELERERRAQLLRFLSDADAHGLPVGRYDSDALRARMKQARTPRDRGVLEVEISRIFLKYARDVQTGVLVPSRVDSRIERDVPYRDRTSYLMEFARVPPAAFFRSLPPQTTEYAMLMKEKLRLQELLLRGGWGPAVPARALEPGEAGTAVAALRDRLIAMGYLSRTHSQLYDADMRNAVERFQIAHGLDSDGVAGPDTMDEINTRMERRLQSVIVAMERERWMNRDRGDRHVLVNIPDFSARIIDHGKVTFYTRAVVGAASDGRTTPEFSDVMEFMVVNPSWYVPRSIVTKEYLPMLRRNPYAVSHIEITDRYGRRVNRGAVNFAQYSAKNFPFSMRQPPSTSNALGLVKFMFPNRHNIYLHDTPSKDLFDHQSRAYSHGCIRLADPFEFAYALLAPQTDDPKGMFHSVLSTGQERRITIENPIPVHIDYRTAFADNKGRIQYRRDVYGRDGRIWDALSNAGVALRAVQG